MSSSALSKIPFIVVYTYCWHKILNPPNPHAPKEELRATTTFDVVSHVSWRINGTIYTQILFSLLEIGTILAASDIPVPSGQTLLSNFRGEPENLRLNKYSMAGFILVVLGAFIRGATYRALGPMFRYQISIQKEHKLIVTGPYSIVRHPGYTGLIFGVTGWFLWNWSEASWVRISGVFNNVLGMLFMAVLSIVGVFAVLVVTLGRMKHEDEALHGEFGKQWEEWAKRVQYFVLPWIW